MSVDVDPDVLAASGSSITAQGDALAAAASALDGALSASDAMSGHDAAGITFGINYTRDGQALLSAAEAAVNACRNIGFGISMSATNYSRAEAASTTGGGDQPLPPPTVPTKFTGPTMPSPYGPGVAEPLLWGLVESFVGDFWPDGEPGELRAAASAWRTFGSAITGSSGEVSAASAGVTSQNIPEGAAMTSAVNEIGQNLTALATQCETTAGQLEGFAGQVEATQNAIRDLLDRLSLSGIVEELGSIFSGRNPWQAVKEVADDIQAVMENMKRQAEGAESMFQMGISELDSAVNSLEDWTRKEFVHYLGEDVGNATATVVNGYLDLQYGGLNSAVDAVHGVQQLDPTRFAYDPEGATKAWAGAVDSAALAVPPLLAAKLAQDPDAVLDQVKGIASYDDWNSDHPLRGLGHNIGDLAQLGIPGGAAAKPAVAAAGAETRVAAAAAQAETRAASGALRDAAGGATRAVGTDISVQGSKIADDLNDIKLPDSSMPAAAPGPSVTPEFKPPIDAPAPRVEPQAAPDAPAPRTPEHTPAVPDTAPPPTPETATTSAVAPDTPAARPQVPESHVSAAAEPAPLRASELAPAHANAPAPVAAEHATAPRAPEFTPPPDASTPHTPIDSPTGGGAPTESPHAPGHTPSTTSAEHGDGSGQSAPHGPDPHHSGQSPGMYDGHPEDPVHSHEQSGDGWHRIDDGPDVPGYGEPLDRHWESGDYPTPHSSNQHTFDLVEHPHEPYGHDANGNPLTKQEYDERYNTLGPNGEPWNNYPPNDGATPGSRVAYDSGDAFLRDYGPQLDRVGGENGSYLGVMPDGLPASFEARSLPISSLELPYEKFMLTELPDGWKIEVSEIAPAFGRDGGGLQALIYNELGEKVPVRTLTKDGVLE